MLRWAAQFRRGSHLQETFFFLFKVKITKKNEKKKNWGAGRYTAAVTNRHHWVLICAARSCAIFESLFLSQIFGLIFRLFFTSTGQKGDERRSRQRSDNVTSLPRSSFLDYFIVRCANSYCTILADTTQMQEELTPAGPLSTECIDHRGTQVRTIFVEKKK